VCAALALPDPWIGLVQLAGALLLVVVAVLGAARVGTVAAEHRGHEVALDGSMLRPAGGDGSLDAVTIASLRVLDADSGVADGAMTRTLRRTASPGATTTVSP
jgi:hypothetical protein